MKKYGTALPLQLIVGHLLYPSCWEPVPEICQSNRYFYDNFRLKILSTAGKKFIESSRVVFKALVYDLIVATKADAVSMAFLINQSPSF